MAIWSHAKLVPVCMDGMTGKDDEECDADKSYETGKHSPLDEASFEYVLSRDKGLVVEPENADLDRGDGHPHE